MPHPALICIAVGAAVAGTVIVRREVLRIERVADAERRARADKLEGVPLQRDPVTGVYRAGDRRSAEPERAAGHRPPPAPPTSRPA